MIPDYDGFESLPRLERDNSPPDKGILTAAPKPPDSPKLPVATRGCGGYLFWILAILIGAFILYRIF